MCRKKAVTVKFLLTTHPNHACRKMPFKIKFKFVQVSYKVESDPLDRFFSNEIVCLLPKRILQF